MATRNGPRFTSDEELRTLSFEDIVRRLRWCENERMRLITDHGNAMKDLKQQLVMKTNENQNLKAENEKLHSDNVELRGLCCFLDDDRQKGRKVSSEWQRFGHYTTSVMRNGVSTYQDKLQELEGRQERLLIENVELRELCFLLDQERTGNQSTLAAITSHADSREAGEGSMTNGPTSLSNDGHLAKEGSSKGMWGNGDFTFPNTDQPNHVPFMEERMRALDDKRQYSQPEARRNGPVPDEKGDGPMQNHMSSASNSVQHPSYPSRNYGPPSVENGNVAPSSPKALVNALKVLEVHDMLERDTPPNHQENDHMNTNEKAIVREMCNVVWRKLGDNPANPNGTGSNGGSSSNSSLTNHSQRPPAPPRYSSSSVNQLPPPRPSGFSTPPYSGGSTGSLERKGI